MDSLKPIFVKALSTAVVSWLIFMSIDFMMLAAFTIAQESHYSLFPGFFSVLALLTCYLSIGILLGLITAIALCIKTALAQGKPSDGFHASLSLSLTANCLINLYSIGRALSMPYQTTVLFILLGGFLFWGLITFTRFLKKKRSSFPPSLVRIARTILGYRQRMFTGWDFSSHGTRYHGSVCFSPGTPCLCYHFYTLVFCSSRPSVKNEKTPSYGGAVFLWYLLIVQRFPKHVLYS
jgi:hypothetical protein